MELVSLFDAHTICYILYKTACKANNLEVIRVERGEYFRKFLDGVTS